MTTYSQPASFHDNRLDGDPTKCGYIIAECITAEDAVAIAAQLNKIRYVPTVKDPDRYRWVSVGYLEGTLRNVPPQKPQQLS